MKVRFKLFGRVFAFYCFKVRKAYGVKSGSQNHVLLMDFDNGNPIKFYTVRKNLMERFPNVPIIMYKTKHGFHAIVFKRFGFRRAVEEMVKTPFIDLNHVAIGISRGYWFLETPQPIPRLTRDVEFMRIERGEA